MSFVVRRATRPAHARPQQPRPQQPRRKSRGGWIVLLLYVAVLGASEWRLQRQLGAATTVEFTPTPAAVIAEAP